MKLLTFIIIFATSIALAETELSCWNISTKLETTPFLTAQVSANSYLTIRFNLKDKFFDQYTYNRSHGESPFHEISLPFQPAGVLKPELIQTNKSPYKGNNEYRFFFGKTHWTSGEITNENILEMRLILPTNLSNSFLQGYRIREGNEKSNAVVIASAPRNSSQRGYTYLRLFCLSR